MSQRPSPTLLWLAGGLGLATALVYGRWRVESSSPLLKGGVGRVAIGSRYDPRDKDLVRRLADRRESDAFRDRLRQRGSAGFRWPGIGAMQVSWTWLEVLQGLHTQSSFEGDFSWLFAELDFILRQGHPKSADFTARLSPFFFVIAQDPAGATYLMNELIDRVPDRSRVWFWAGFHAAENIRQNALAADLYLRSSRLPGAPPTAALVAARLRYGHVWNDPVERKRLLTEEIDPVLRRQIQQFRPEFFE